MNHPQWARTLADLAARFQVSRSALRKWARLEPSAFKKSPRGYDVAAVRRWRRRYFEQNPNSWFLPCDDDPEPEPDPREIERKLRVECLCLLKRSRGQ